MDDTFYRRTGKRWRNIGEDDFYWWDFHTALRAELMDFTSPLHLAEVHGVKDLESVSKAHWYNPVHDRIVDVMNMLQQTNYILQSANSEKRVKAPTPIERPWEKKKESFVSKAIAVPTSEIDEMLGW